MNIFDLMEKNWEKLGYEFFRDENKIILVNEKLDKKIILGLSCFYLSCSDLNDSCKKFLSVEEALLISAPYIAFIINLSK